ncbi:MAG: glycosyltransferase [Cyclobacteriaceae bacterium]
MYFYSVIIPVFNRPGELDELLSSLTKQAYSDFEVIVVEDGSARPAADVVRKYNELLKIRYIEKENSGQGFSRNRGFEEARGDYFIVFDSDCIIPPGYFSAVEKHLEGNRLDAFGGPDRAHGSFTPMQKAISCSMTSPLTTGGIRGNKKRLGPFHPRSFNMGISREVYNTVGGYKITRMGEDIELSIRIHESGFSVGLIPDAFVYHKRRTSFRDFFKQLHFFGRARINIGRFYPSEIRVVHFFPMVFTIGFLLLWFLPLISMPLFKAGLLLYGIYFVLLFTDSLMRTKDFGVALLTVPAGFIQLFAYGLGFMSEGWKRIMRG